MCLNDINIGGHCLPLVGTVGIPGGPPGGGGGPPGGINGTNNITVTLPEAMGGAERLLTMSHITLASAMQLAGVLNVTRPCGDGYCDPRYERVPENWQPDPAIFDGVCYSDCGCGDGYCDRDGSLGSSAGGFPAETTESCPVDCACGDGRCTAEYGEDLSSCPQDCQCGNGMCDNWCTASQLEMMNPGYWRLEEITSNCNETTATCGIDCHCGDNVCDVANWGETEANCPQDCYCGDGVCSEGENWLNCESDCEAVCGNGICECTSDGAWGSPLCCFGGLSGNSQSSYCSPTNIGGPETEESCPFDCGTPCPPFCDVAVCRDGLTYFPSIVDTYEIEYRETGAAASATNNPMAMMMDPMMHSQVHSRA